MFCPIGAPGAGRLTLAGGTTSVTETSGCDGVLVVVLPAATDPPLSLPSATVRLTARTISPTTTMMERTTIVRRRCPSVGAVTTSFGDSGCTTATVQAARAATDVKQTFSQRRPPPPPPPPRPPRPATAAETPGRCGTGGRRCRRRRRGHGRAPRCGRRATGQTAGATPQRTREPPPAPRPTPGPRSP